MKLLELLQRLMGSHAVLFEKIKESNFRLIANLVGTRKRFAIAVGGTENNIHEKVISAIKKAKHPKSFLRENLWKISQKTYFLCL